MSLNHTAVTSDQLAVLQLLLVGGTRRITASRLHVSPRTVDLRVAELRELLRTADRWCMGTRSVRWGLVARRRLVLDAEQRRPSAVWVAPTPRQFEVMLLRASGATPKEAAAQLAISPRTVRYDLAKITLANGAANDMAAGALFEALGWTSNLSDCPI